ncbi:MAG: hypothetical protein CMJ27_02070, partial [Phycisphaerae bacterium]|nr:hypothetical protein [Phycisphaerae bacterium]
MTPNRSNTSRRWTAALAGTAAAISGAFVSATAVADVGNIPETAVASGRLDTLVAAVQAAGLAEALSGPGPLTVFAPTDAAFARLGEENVAGLDVAVDDLLHRVQIVQPAQR